MAEKIKKLPKVVYSTEEEDWLVSNALEYRDIIDNKKTDGLTKRDKDRAWEEIAKAFNVAPPSQERSVKSLREKYQKIKQNLKNRVFYFAKDAKQTGGGPSKKELPALSEPMQELFKSLIPSTYGLSAATGDSDYIVVNKPARDHPGAEINPIAVAASVTFKEIKIEDEMFVFEDESNELLLPDKAADCLENTGKQNLKVPKHAWERVSPAKLREPPNPLLNNRRRRYRIETEMETPNKIPKLSEEIEQHLVAKHAMELEILDSERERYKLLRESATVDLQRASFERERAEFDRERSLVELERAKNHLSYDDELHNIRIKIMKESNTERIQTAVPLKKFFC